MSGQIATIEGSFGGNSDACQELFIGVIGNADISAVIEAVREASAVPVVFSQGVMNLDGVKTVSVGRRDSDITIDSATDQELLRYLSEISDIVVSPDFQLEIDVVRREKGTVYVVNDTIYEGFKKTPFTVSALSAAAADMLSDYRDESDELKSPFWKNCYKSFMKPFKRGGAEGVTREFPENEIAAEYRKYDSRANKYNAIYRSSLFLRALLPLLATVALAFALNIETVFGAIVKTRFWGFTVIAFFLMQALFNYLIIALSDYVVKHKIIPVFTTSRYLAENLRMLSITAPNSLPRMVNNRINFNDVAFSGVMLNKEIERLKRKNFSLKNTIDSLKIDEIALDLDALLSEQIDYHRKTAKIMDKCADYLMKIAKTFFVIGLLVVIGRGIYQSVIVVVEIDAVINGVKMSDFFSKLFNVFALVVPAITVMYMGLRQSLNVDNNYTRSVIMADKLTEIKDALKSVGSCYELINIVSVLNTLMIDEASDWYIATEQKRVSKM